jgi:hypothetical protein
VVGGTRVAQSHYIFTEYKNKPPPVPQGTTHVLLAGLDVGYADTCTIFEESSPSGHLLPSVLVEQGRKVSGVVT